MNAQTHAVDRDDIQGLLRSGYGHHTEACFLLLRISDLQIVTRKEGTDDLTLQVGLATIYLPAESREAAR